MKYDLVQWSSGLYATILRAIHTVRIKFNVKLKTIYSMFQWSSYKQWIRSENAKYEIIAPMTWSTSVVGYHRTTSPWRVRYRAAHFSRLYFGIFVTSCDEIISVYRKCYNNSVLLHNNANTLSINSDIWICCRFQLQQTSIFIAKHLCFWNLIRSMKKVADPWSRDEQEVISFFFQYMQTSQAAYYWNEDNFNFCFMKLLFRNLKMGEMKKSKKVDTAEICFKYQTACLRETLLIIVFFFLLSTFG